MNASAGQPDECDEATYLKRLGARVRQTRARRGVTRRALARDSGVSERYLAQLEAGRANISVGRLRRVARALGVAVEALARDGPERPAALALFLERLGRLGVGAQAEALDLLGQRFGAALDGARADRVALIGLRGAGKTTLGQHLAKEFGVPFIEMTREVERDSGLSLQELFDLSGQAAYRRYERRALGRVLESHSAVVIAAGGSIVSEPSTYDRLLGACLTVWLKAAPEDHMGRVVAQGDTRPMADNPEAMADLERILEERAALYGKADLVVETSGHAPAESAAALVAAVALARARGTGAAHV
jgi:XRE family aerobic/anaerobic benzoate catabolism transcriptional regulator